MNTIQKLNTAVVTKPSDNMNIDTAKAQEELNNLIAKVNTLKLDKATLVSDVGTIMNLASDNTEYQTLIAIKDKFNEVYDLLIDDVEELQKLVQTKIDNLRAAAGANVSEAQAYNQSLQNKQFM